MEIAVSGASGLIGSALVARLTAAGHAVSRLVRTQPAESSPDIYWDPPTSYVDSTKLSGKEVVIHLAGETISQRWTPAAKRRIHASRVRGTQVIAEALRQVVSPPSTFISASAIGYYGDRGEEILREESTAGTGFLPSVCRDWEAATEPAERVGIRVVHLRTGIVLNARGGALAKMLPPFRMGLGGKIGSGRQYMSWISLEDHVAAIEHIIASPSLRGPINLVSPTPVTNKVFTQALAKSLSRPAIFPLPRAAVRILFGQMGEELLLGSQRVEARRLISSGFSFQYPDLPSALRQALGV